MSEDYVKNYSQNEKISNQYSINRNSNVSFLNSSSKSKERVSDFTDIKTVTQDLSSKTEPEKVTDEKLQNQEFKSSVKFFLKHSCRDLKRRKCHYCLAFCSVFIVVLFSLVINTIVDRGPIIFLRMAEGSQGEIDGIVTSSTTVIKNLNDPEQSYDNFLNYTRVQELYDSKYNLSPRKYFCGILMGSDSYNSQLLTEDDIKKWHDQFDRETQLPTRKQSYSKNINRFINSCLILLETEREKQIELGHSYQHPPLEYGECNINIKNQKYLDIDVGDIIYLDMDITNLMFFLLQKYNDYANQNGLPYIQHKYTKVKFPCKVKRFTDGSMGKIPNSDLALQQMMEYQPFLRLIANYLPQQYYKDYPDFVKYLQDKSKITLQEFTDYFVMTLPEPRASYYESSNFDDIQKKVTNYANKVTEDLGYYPIKIDLPILGEMEQYSMAVLFLGLIFDIIILLFVIIAILLIYSLLMISVDSKTFEIGVMRMVGLSKNGLIFMIIMQSSFFVLPAIIMAFIMSFLVIKVIYVFLLSSSLGINFVPVPQRSAVFQALILGLVIPLVSSILPIKSVLTKNLNDALDYQRSKTQAIYIEILDKNKRSISTFIFFGLLSVVYGLAIYYFLPLAMLTFNFGLVLQIFFFILLGMLFGLSLLAFNLQRLLEIAFTYVFLFYEKHSMRLLVQKNLVAHRMRNKFTSIIYSLALGFIIFLFVSYNLQMQQTQLIMLKKRGSYLQIQAKEGYSLNPKTFDKVLQENQQLIESFAYITYSIQQQPNSTISSTQISDRSRINQFTVNLYGIAPSMFDAAISNYLKVYYQNQSTSLSLADQLYSARGSQGIALGSFIAKNTITDKPNVEYNETLMMMFNGDKNIYYQVRPIFIADSAPVFTMTSREVRGNSILTSLPMLALYSGISMDRVVYRQLLVKVKDPTNIKHYTLLSQEFQNAGEYKKIDIQDASSSDETNKQVSSILNIIFNCIILIIMFLCFFSLSSSMSANLYEQSKELGILRAIGLKKGRIVMLYIYEAFILVISSSILGILIGTLVGFTMTLQQVLFTDIPIVFFFPWVQFLIVLGISVICAFASTFGPTRNLLKKEISQIFRIA